MSKPTKKEIDAGRKQLEDLKSLRNDYISVFATPAGQRVAADMKKRAFMKTTTYMHGSPTASDDMKVFEGRRQMYLHVETMQEMDVEKLIELQRQLWGGS